MFPPKPLKKMKKSHSLILPGPAPSVKVGAPPKKRPIGQSTCVNCSATVNKFYRKYCDVCWKAFMSQRRGTPRRIDGNQPEIVQALRRIGCHVLELSFVGGGVPDLVVWKRDGLTARLVEIKNPASKGKLNELQERWHRDWTGAKPLIIESVDQAMEAFNQ